MHSSHGRKREQNDNGIESDVVGIYGETDRSINSAWYYELYRQIEKKGKEEKREREERQREREKEEEKKKKQHLLCGGKDRQQSEPWCYPIFVTAVIIIITIVSHRRRRRRCRHRPLFLCLRTKESGRAVNILLIRSHRSLDLRY